MSRYVVGLLNLRPMADPFKFYHRGVRLKVLESHGHVPARIRIRRAIDQAHGDIGIQHCIDQTVALLESVTPEAADPVVYKAPTAIRIQRPKIGQQIGAGLGLRTEELADRLLKS